MGDFDATASSSSGAMSLERQHLALALRALAATARGQVEAAEEAMQILAERAALLAAPPPRSSFLRLVHWR